MKKMNMRKAATLATVLLLALVGCQSESPTEPSTGGGGGTTPPTSEIAITLTASNSNPVAGSSTLITARATTGGTNVVDGTAIEFSTTFGTFTETSDAVALRTTSGGAATVTLTSAVVGTAQVTARLGAVSRTITVTFKLGDSGGGTGPTISSVTPASGPPAGNQLVTITGTNLKAPVRVFFGAKEATVVSASETQIKALTPAVNLGSSDEFLVVDVRVITKAGSSSENAATLTGGYRYELEILTPEVTIVSPSSGPNEGNTRITIFGQGFQSPVKVFFGSSSTQVEVEVVSVSFSQIQAITPPAAGFAAAFHNASVSMRVLNVASNKDVTFPDAFRYGPQLDITGVSPATGSHLGGDRITIFGFGFDDPVLVTIGGVPARVIRVSGTEIVALTGALLDCSSGVGEGAVTVTNLEQPSGDGSGTVLLEGAFTYLVTTKILSVAPLPFVEGGAATVTVDDPGLGNVKFTVGGKTVFPTPASATDPFAATVFSFVVPTGLEFDTEDCVTGGGVTGTRNTITDFDVVFQNILTGCEAEISIPVSPLDVTCVTDPTITVAPSSLSFTDSVLGAGGQSLSVTITNVGGVNVTLSSPTTAAPFAVTAGPGLLTLTPGQSTSVTVTYTATAVGTQSGTLTIPFNGGSETVSLSGTGTP